MTVETNANFITDLNQSYPRARDLISEGDDHIRLIKSILLNTLPSYDRAVTMTAEKLNTLDSTFTLDTNGLNINSGVKFKASSKINANNNKIENLLPPTAAGDAVNLGYLQSTGAWPVGSIYMSVDTRNPNLIFGFGTWVAFATGRVILGSGSWTDINNETKTFTNSGSGGEYSHKLSVNEMPSHTFPVNGLTISSAGAHKHTIAVGGGSSGPRQVVSIDSNINDGYEWKGSTLGGKPSVDESGSHTHQLLGTLPSVGNDARHNNIQPYIVCNIWRRTA